VERYRSPMLSRPDILTHFDEHGSGHGPGGAHHPASARPGSQAVDAVRVEGTPVLPKVRLSWQAVPHGLARSQRTPSRGVLCLLSLNRTVTAVTSTDSVCYYDFNY
jgi:hypothetical protein